MSGEALLPAASLADVARGRAGLVGSRLDPTARPGVFSPVEPRVLMGIPYGDLVEEERSYLSGQRSIKRDAGVVTRALLARALSPTDAPRPPRPYVVAAPVDNLTIDDALEAIFAEPEGHARMVHFVHAHALNLASFDPELRDCYRRADLVLGDGIGLRLGARILGVAMRHNLNGTDLLPLLCAEAARRGVPLALVGGAEGVASTCADKLRERTPGLSTPVISHGYLDAEGAARVVDEIRALGRSVVLVGMGSPIQERWAWSHLTRLPHATVITVGGLFDFFSDRIPRAPQVWRELGVEWVWRLKEEPRRLAKRYLLGNPLFLSLAAAQRLTGQSV